MAKKKLGRVKMFNERNGWGHIKEHLGPDIFFHASNFPRGIKPTPDMCVSYVEGTNPRNDRRWAEQIEIQNMEGK